jgi:hypothetical protein
MVHVPILKIDIPEPRLSYIIPGTIDAIVRLLSVVYEVANDFLHPLSPEAQAAYDEAVVRSLPAEHRLLRKRIAERGVADLDQISDELEEATRSYYRRAMREGVAGYPDETADDAAWRQLTSPDRASDAVWAQYAAQQADPAAQAEAMQHAALLTEEERAALVDAQARQAAARLAAAAAREADDRLFVPSTARRITVASAYSASGLAVGVGLAKLFQVRACCPGWRGCSTPWVWAGGPRALGWVGRTRAAQPARCPGATGAHAAASHPAAGGGAGPQHSPCTACRVARGRMAAGTCAVTASNARVPAPASNARVPAPPAAGADQGTWQAAHQAQGDATHSRDTASEQPGCQVGRPAAWGEQGRR